MRPPVNLVDGVTHAKHSWVEITHKTKIQRRAQWSKMADTT